MQKVIFPVLVLLLCLNLWACQSSNSDADSEKTTHVHSFGQWTVSTPASCSAPGEEVRSCKCGEEEVKSVPQLDHTYGEWTVKTEATCSAPGTKMRVCACGAQESQSIPVAEHAYVESSSVAPTPANPVGQITYRCNTCGDTYTETVKSYGSQGLTYRVIDQEGEGGICVITSMGSCKDKELAIPKYIDGYMVVEIGKEAFIGCDTITSVVIPDSVFAIHEKAFLNCVNLKSVVLSNSLITIEREAFHMCRSLREIALPDSLRYIGSMAFRLTNLGELVIPDSVISIEDDAFNACYMTSVTLSKNVKSLEYGIFANCINLTSVVIPEGVTKINEQVFAGCEKLTSVTIPSSVTFLSDGVFLFCTKLTEIHYQGTVAQWKAIQKGTVYDVWDWDEGTGYYTIYCIDGQIEKGAG